MWNQKVAAKSVTTNPSNKPRGGVDGNLSPLDRPIILEPVDLFPNNTASLSRDPNGGVTAVLVPAGDVAWGCFARGSIAATSGRKRMSTTRVIKRTRCMCALGTLDMAKFEIESGRCLKPQL